MRQVRECACVCGDIYLSATTNDECENILHLYYYDYYVQQEFHKL